METNDNKDLGDKKWNNAQQENAEHELNEGFSGENLPDDYNPAKRDLRSKNVDNDVDNSVIHNKKSLENRDHNYDTDASRYKGSKDNNENRGNLELDNN